MPAFTGVIPPLCTPLTPDGALDRRSLARLCEFLLAAEVDGLFVGGSTGEVALLSDEDRVAALSVAVDVAAGAVPVLYGAIDTSTARTIARGEQAEQARLTRLFGIIRIPDRTRIGFTAAALGAFKAALALRGVIAHDTTCAPLTDDERATIAELLAETGLSSEP